MIAGKGDEIAVGCEDSMTYLVDVNTQVPFYNLSRQSRVHKPYQHVSLSSRFPCKPLSLKCIFNPLDTFSLIPLLRFLFFTGNSEAVGGTFIPRDLSGLRPRRNLDGHWFLRQDCYHLSRYVLRSCFCSSSGHVSGTLTL